MHEPLHLVQQCLQGVDAGMWVLPAQPPGLQMEGNCLLDMCQPLYSGG